MTLLCKGPKDRCIERDFWDTFVSTDKSIKTGFLERNKDWILRELRMTRMKAKIPAFAGMTEEKGKTKNTTEVESFLKALTAE